MNDFDDTIAAIATPVGIGGLSVIRISGKNAIEKIATIFKGKHDLTKVKTYTAHYGKIVGPDQTTIEEIIVTVFRAPHSYTMEDIVEISCHGGYYNSKKLLEIIISTGIRISKPGEFTQRAFLNGRIDLAQAEAVADLIKAESDHYHYAAIAQLEGLLSNEIKNLRDKLLNICSLLELELDFVEENIQLKNSITLRNDVEEAMKLIQGLIESYRVGKIYKDGVGVVIIGKPNVGKSSILNSLLNEKRVIVTEIPGTTRDIIEESIIIDGLVFRISDTAGIRKTFDPVESEGISRTFNKLESAQIAIIVIDPTVPLSNEDIDILDDVRNMKDRQTSPLVVVNKIDVNKPTDEIIKLVNSYLVPHVLISAKTQQGFNLFKNMLYKLSMKGLPTNQEHCTIIISGRHHNCLIRASESLKNALQNIVNNAGNELIVIDLRQAMDYLGEIVGITTSDDILNNIFSKFCIGK